MDDPRAAVVAEARRWVGTPYRHQASVRGAGADCLGLVRGVWRALRGAEPVAVPPYGPDWAEAGRDEALWRALAGVMARNEPDGLPILRPPVVFLRAARGAS